MNGTNIKKAVLFADQALSFGGSLVVLSNLVNALSKDYVAIVIGELEINYLRKYFGNVVTLYSMPRPYNYLMWMRHKQGLAVIKSEFVSQVITYALSLIRTLANSIYVFRLLLIVIKHKVGIVHVNNGMLNLPPIVAAAILNTKCVVHVHGIERYGFLQKMFVGKVSRFIAVSECIRSNLLSNGIPSQRITVVPNPVRKQCVDTRKLDNLHLKMGLGEDDLVVGIVGRICDWKGQIYFLKAAKIVLEEFSTAKVLMVGEYQPGDVGYKNQIDEFIDSSGIRDRVIFAGHVDRVTEYYRLMDVCVHASIRPEPFGLVITEAMAVGTPVVVSLYGAPKEIITDGETGYLVDPKSTGSLSGRISQLLRSRELRERIGKKGKQYVLQHYNLSDYAKRIEEIYETLYSK